MKPNHLSALSKSEKILVAIYKLGQSDKNKITVEDVAVKLWKMWPSEFCMRGYPQYPNVDIQKYITKLLDNNLIVGGVYNYKITEKGKQIFEKITDLEHKKDKKMGEVTAEQPRYIRSEVKRIINSNVFKYFLKDESAHFLESDFFEFLGTSARSLSTKDKNIFLTRLNTVVKDVIPYCIRIREKDEYADKIVRLWEILSEHFKRIIEMK